MTDPYIHLKPLGKVLFCLGFMILFFAASACDGNSMSTQRIWEIIVAGGMIMLFGVFFRRK